jgi:pimeloyl-ACP methyl ester carboxylesterase
MTTPFPGARAPDRTRVLDVQGVCLRVCEWGAPDAPPVLLAHGIADFARSFDLLAPALADAGWRAVAWDQRGHGDSDHTDLYSWQADVRDLLAVADSCGAAAMPAVGHSKGGSLLAWAVQALPWRFSQLVLLDGLSFNSPSLAAQDLWRGLLSAQGLQRWVARQTEPQTRCLPTRDALVSQRAKANPRLPRAWIEHLVSVGARHTADGWFWKHDPRAVAPLVGPHPSQWMLRRLAGMSPQLLAIVGGVRESISWKVALSEIEPHLPPGAAVENWPDVGHFVHIEAPQATALRVLSFLRRP